MKVEVSAAVSAVSVSTAEAKREKINALNKKTYLKAKITENQTSLFLFQLGKKIPQECSII